MQYIASVPILFATTVVNDTFHYDESQLAQVARATIPVLLVKVIRGTSPMCLI